MTAGTREGRLRGHELTLADLHQAHDDDEGEGQQLAGGEHVLHPGGPPHAGAVHPRQQHWTRTNETRHSAELTPIHLTPDAPVRGSSEL